MKKFYFTLIALVAFTFNAMAQTEIWDSNFTLDSWFGDANWSPETESTVTLDNGVVKVKIAQNKDGQWKAQVKLVTNLTQLKADKQYDFTCKANSNVEVSGITFKMMDNVEMKFENQSLKLSAGDNTISEKNIDGSDGVSNGTIVFDFGWAQAGTEITLSDFSLVEHDPVAAEAVTAWDATASDNLWPANLTPGSYWYAPGWTQIADPTITVNGERSFSLNFPIATTDQWQAQVHIPSGITTHTDTNYDLQVVLNSTTDIAGATIKFVKVDDDGTYYCTDRHKLTAGEDFVYQLENVAGIDMGELKLVLDFGGNPANTDVTVKDIIVREHSDAPEVVDDYMMVGTWQGWSFENNPLKFTYDKANKNYTATIDKIYGDWKIVKNNSWDNALGGGGSDLVAGKTYNLVPNGDNTAFAATITNAKFTLTVAADGNATLKVEGENVETEKTYGLVGEFNSWNNTDESQLMTKQADGSYTIHVTDFPCGKSWKISCNKSWKCFLGNGNNTVTVGEEYNCAYGDNNNNLSIAGDGTFTGTIALYNIVDEQSATIKLTDDAAGISDVYDNATLNANLYNTVGQRVNANAKGILIKNGNKYLVK